MIAAVLFAILITYSKSIHGAPIEEIQPSLPQQDPSPIKGSDVFDGFYFTGENPLDAGKSSGDPQAGKIPAHMSDIESLLKSYKNMKETRTKRIEALDLYKHRKRRDISLMETVFNVKHPDKYENMLGKRNYESQQKLKESADEAELKESIIDSVLLEIAAKLYPNERNERQRKETLEMLRKLPNQEKFDTAVMNGIIINDREKKKDFHERHRRSANHIHPKKTIGGTRSEGSITIEPIIGKEQETIFKTDNILQQDAHNSDTSNGGGNRKKHPDMIYDTRFRLPLEIIETKKEERRKREMEIERRNNLRLKRYFESNPDIPLPDDLKTYFDSFKFRPEELAEVENDYRKQEKGLALNKKINELVERIENLRQKALKEPGKRELIYKDIEVYETYLEDLKMKRQFVASNDGKKENGDEKIDRHRMIRSIDEKAREQAKRHEKSSTQIMMEETDDVSLKALLAFHANDIEHGEITTSRGHSAQNPENQKTKFKEEGLVSPKSQEESTRLRRDIPDDDNDVDDDNDDDLSNDNEDENDDDYDDDEDSIEFQRRKQPRRKHFNKRKQRKHRRGKKRGHKTFDRRHEKNEDDGVKLLIMDANRDAFPEYVKQIEHKKSTKTRELLNLLEDFNPEFKRALFQLIGVWDRRDHSAREKKGEEDIDQMLFDFDETFAEDLSKLLNEWLKNHALQKQDVENIDHSTMNRLLDKFNPNFRTNLLKLLQNWKDSENRENKQIQNEDLDNKLSNLVRDIGFENAMELVGLFKTWSNYLSHFKYPKMVATKPFVKKMKYFNSLFTVEFQQLLERWAIQDWDKWRDRTEAKDLQNDMVKASLEEIMAKFDPKVANDFIKFVNDWKVNILHKKVDRNIGNIDRDQHKTEHGQSNTFYRQRHIDNGQRHIDDGGRNTDPDRIKESNHNNKNGHKKEDGHMEMDGIGAELTEFFATVDTNFVKELTNIVSEHHKISNFQSTVERFSTFFGNKDWRKMVYTLEPKLSDRIMTLLEKWKSLPLDGHLNIFYDWNIQKIWNKFDRYFVEILLKILKTWKGSIKSKTEKIFSNIDLMDIPNREESTVDYEFQLNKPMLEKNYQETRNSNFERIEKQHPSPTYHKPYVPPREHKEAKRKHYLPPYRMQVGNPNNGLWVNKMEDINDNGNIPDYQNGLDMRYDDGKNKNIDDGDHYHAESRVKLEDDDDNIVDYYNYKYADEVFPIHNAERNGEGAFTPNGKPLMKTRPDKLIIGSVKHLPNVVQQKRKHKPKMKHYPPPVEDETYPHNGYARSPLRGKRDTGLLETGTRNGNLDTANGNGKQIVSGTHEAYFH